MALEKAKGIAGDPNWTAKNPNWNKVVVIPISTTTVTVNNVESIVKVEHDMSLTSTRLVGGSANPNEPVKINVIYSKFNHK